MKRLALQGALTAKFGDGAIKVVDELSMDASKTRELVGYLDALKATGRVVLVAVAATTSWPCRRATCPTVSILSPDSLNVVDVLNADVLLICQPALATMAEVYA
jgi:large subunit ribosomal protein L4